MFPIHIKRVLRTFVYREAMLLMGLCYDIALDAWIPSVNRHNPKEG